MSDNFDKLLKHIPVWAVPFIPGPAREYIAEAHDFECACSKIAAIHGVDPQTVREKLNLLHRRTIWTWRHWTEVLEADIGWLDCRDDEIVEWAMKKSLEILAKRLYWSPTKDIVP
jgi:hypothetical protein